MSNDPYDIAAASPRFLPDNDPRTEALELEEAVHYHSRRSKLPSAQRSGLRALESHLWGIADKHGIDPFQDRR